MEFEYNWLESFASLVLSIAIVAAGRFVFFKIPKIKQSHDHNRQENRRKFKAKGDKYRDRHDTSTKVALATNLVFFVAILPFFITFETSSVGTVLWHSFLILMTYDLFYYLTHRFLFHGQGYFRKVHAVHHQARTRVSSADSLLLHPLEAFIGIALFFTVTAVLALILGGPFSIATIIICNVIYTQINQINHTRIDLKGFPYSTLSWIATSHDSHHINMHKGNFATITLLYDWLFRTLEPINQPEQITATDATPANDPQMQKSAA